MKFLIVSLAVLAVVAADVSHLSPTLRILKQGSDASPDGQYNFSYETENGIVAEQSGQPGPAGPEGQALVSRGSYKYVGDDGATYEVQYTADENGYHPQGAHIPAIPEGIQRSLEYNQAHPQPEEVQAKPSRF